jgi:hypothetical protein
MKGRVPAKSSLADEVWLLKTLGCGRIFASSILPNDREEAEATTQNRSRALSALFGSIEKIKNKRLFGHPADKQWRRVIAGVT